MKMNEIQIKIVNNIISKWRRALLSAKTEDEKSEIKQEIKLLEEKLEDDRRIRNRSRGSS